MLFKDACNRKSNQ
jgi:ribonucleoside-diphosphate reductase alpha subunit